MYFYIFTNDAFIDELSVLNTYNEIEQGVIARELLSKNGENSVVIASKQRFYNPRLKDGRVAES